MQNKRTPLKRRTDKIRGVCVKGARGCAKLAATGAALAVSASGGPIGIVLTEPTRFALYNHWARKANEKFTNKVFHAYKQKVAAQNPAEKDKWRQKLHSYTNRMHRNQLYHTGLTKRHIKEMSKNPHWNHTYAAKLNQWQQKHVRGKYADKRAQEEAEALAEQIRTEQTLRLLKERERLERGRPLWRGPLPVWANNTHVRTIL